jgi:hypothetical protein
MKHFFVSVALAFLSAVSMTVHAKQQPDCKPTAISKSVLDELSRPARAAPDTETDDAAWEGAQAIAERDREYSAIERRHDDKAYRVAAPLIDAQYDVAEAEIAQVLSRQVQVSARDFDLARSKLDAALRAAKLQSKKRPSIAALWDQLQRADLGTTLCHCQSRGDVSDQYESLKASIRRVIGAL